ncbi:MAG: hypothetical protein H6719_35745 [Sandaracinaceae bacterium]|nr:hypothetical protein [Sandaracinaceae bacterium]
MRSTSLWLLGVLAIGALPGCGLTLDDPEDPGLDAGATMDSGGGGTPCGPVTCGAGLECCNASCGTCVGPGGSCTDQECFDAGEVGPDAGRDAGADGGGGVACGSVTCLAGQMCCPGCGTDTFCASGSDCPVPTCPPPSCGDSVACPDTEYCARPFGTCGGEGTCEPIPEVCPSDCGGVCGCDGRTYCNACEANAEGVTAAMNTPCAPPTRACAAMDVVSEGDCLIVLGFAWNGFSCTQIDCLCTGTQCGELFTTLAACQRAYETCNCGGFIGRGCPVGSFCDYPPEAMCGAGDADGACHARAMGCTGMDAPVCGCDSLDYPNACYANSAGVAVAHEGRCTAPGPGTP